MQKQGGRRAGGPAGRGRLAVGARGGRSMGVVRAARRDTGAVRAARRGLGVLPGAAWACCWVVGCALGALSLFLTRFDSVLFLSQFFWTLFVNPVHEHCSSRNFSKKKILN